MIQLKDIGRFETLPDRAMQIVEGHVPALREAIAQGWDIEEEITLSKYTALRPDLPENGYDIECIQFFALTDTVR